MVILNLASVSKCYGRNIVLKDISYSITQPEVIGLVAPNGSGKSTLFDVITNIARSDIGKVEILGEKNTSHKIFREVSYMQDNSILYPDLTAFDHLKYVAHCHQKTIADIVLTTEKLSMTHYIHKKVKNYSLGMKQMLLLAMSIINEPKLLLLDEPINGLDVTACDTFRKVILDLHSKGITVILSSHNLEEIEKITDHVLFLSGGQLLSSNDPGLIERLNDKSTRYQVILSSAQEVHSLLKERYPCSIRDTFKLEIDLTEAEKTTFVQLCTSNKIEIYEIRPLINRVHQLYDLLFQKTVNEEELFL